MSASNDSVKLSLWDCEGVKLDKTIDLSESVFAHAFNESLVHQSLLAYQANGHQRTKAQKNRSEVKGTTAKPWRQKGTGRARAGDCKSPLWRGGGVTFASRSDQKTPLLKINKKMYRKALCCIFSKLVDEERLIVLESWDDSKPKTAIAEKRLKAFNANSIFFVVSEVSENLYLSMRNLHYIEVADVSGINPFNLIQADKLLVTKEAVKQIEEWLNGK